MKVYCPRCGQEQISAEVRFCSRCGFVMTGMTEIVLGGGIPQQLMSNEPKPPTARRRGLKQGGAWFLLGVMMVPLLAILHELMRFPVEFVGLAAVIFFIGGIVRMVFALIFESGNPQEKTLEENVFQTAQKFLNKKKPSELPEGKSIPTEGYVPPRAANWRDTNDLEPSSVTDHTTKLFGKDK